MKKILTIIGARPQIIKASAISRAIANKYKEELKEIIVHTGQHYDENMSNVFFKELGIPVPDYNLEVGSGNHGQMTAKMIASLEEVILKEQPNAVLIYGDTNSTIAGALAAAKIHVPVIHVEAGLRSFNKSMPEEINRICSDHMSTMMFTPTKTGLHNLKNEGFNIDYSGTAFLDCPRIYLCGDVMYDNSLHFSSISESSSKILSDNDMESDQYVLVTIHRDSNTDNPDNLNNIFKALIEIRKEFQLKIVLPLHPRTNSRLNSTLEPSVLEHIREDDEFIIMPPAGFLDIISLEKNARMIVTDSGGIQKEAFFFRKPCVILRPQTEWVEIVNNGNAVLADADFEKIMNGFRMLISKDDYTYPEFYGDGTAAEFICERIISDLG
jgi:UDP-GlcNAc3NAcA epimerase